MCMYLEARGNFQCLSTGAMSILMCLFLVALSFLGLELIAWASMVNPQGSVQPNTLSTGVTSTHHHTRNAVSGTFSSSLLTYKVRALLTELSPQPC